MVRKVSDARAEGRPTTKLHLLALDDRRAWSFSLSAGHRHGVLEGRPLFQKSGLKHPKHLDDGPRAQEGGTIRRGGWWKNGVPHPWSFDRKLYARHNEVERWFGRLKRYRRGGDVLRQTRPLMFAGFIYLALICEMIRNLVDTTTGQNNHLLNTDED